MTATVPTARPASDAGAVAPDGQVARLNSASSRRPIEPDTHLPWGTLGTGQVIADELLSIDGLDARR